jgi:polysaccharide pyruvyl transferase WcaK-like protein
MKRVLILGYYFKQNFGDDLFEYTFKKYIFNDKSKYELDIVNLDALSVVFEKLESKAIKPYDFVIVGGGDLINNDYFDETIMNNIRTYFALTPVIFYGIGLSYPDLLPTLDVGDYFFMRNQIDHLEAKQRFSSYFASYTPDLAYFLMNERSLQNYRRSISAPLSRIGVCLPYTWFTNSQTSNAFMLQLVETIKGLSVNYEVHVIPFDTSSNHANSDLILLDVIRQYLTDYEFDADQKQRIFYVTAAQSNSNIDPQIKVTRMIEYFKSLDLVLGSRFHSVIMSILTETPFVSLYTTKKLDNMKNELPATLTKLFLEAKTDQDLIPISFDTQEFDNAVDYAMSNRELITEELRNTKTRLFASLKKAHSRLLKIMTSPDYTVRYTPPQYISETEKSVMVTKTLSNVLRSIDKMSPKNLKMVESNYPISKIISRRKQASSGYMEKVITEEILWNITQDPYGPYYYGLFDSACDAGLAKRLSWLISDYYSRFKYKSFNSQWITVMNKNFQELHRSGWQFIVDNIVMELNSNTNITKPIVIDTYVDKTFHWNSSFYSSKDMIPYTQDWIGFIHHTYSFYNNTYNCKVLFENDLFKESLKNCKCLIVMSKYLKRQIDESLEILYNDPIAPLTNRVEVEVLYHPSEVTENMFVWEDFISQPQKQVVQIGNWLRNMFSIYQLELPAASIITGKSALKNKNTDNYFPPKGFVEEVFAGYDTKKNLNNNIYDICKITFDNMHVKGLYEHITELENSVQVMEYLDNDTYDDLLARNIVFINLVDASAVNTIIECALRNTPILVNPIEPVVELLGPDYPYYYNSMYHASKLLEDTDKMKEAYDYLSSMDKSRFHISTFMNGMRGVVSKFIQ